MTRLDKDFPKVGLLSFLLSMLLSVANAEKVGIEGIYYNINDNQSTAEVTYRGDEEDGWMYFTADELYTDDVTIPPTITYRGNSYEVKSIGNDAFAGSKNMTTLHLPSTVTNIGTGIFSLCNSLQSISVEEGNPMFFSHKDILYQKNPDQIFFVPKNIQGDIELIESITTIPSSAFQNRLGLKTITLPEGITTIADGAFNKCTNLQEVFFGDNVTTIGEQAFSDCSNLTIVNIPQSVKRIKTSAFLNCANLNYVLLYDGIEQIDKMAFYNCPNILGIHLPSTLNSIGEKAFYGCQSLGVIQNDSKLPIEIGSEEYGYVAYYAYDIIQDITGCNDTKQTEATYLRQGDWLTIYNAANKHIKVFSVNGQIIYDNKCSEDVKTIFVGPQRVFAFFLKNK